MFPFNAQSMPDADDLVSAQNQIKADKPCVSKENRALSLAIPVRQLPPPGAAVGTAVIGCRAPAQLNCPVAVAVWIERAAVARRSLPLAARRVAIFDQVRLMCRETFCTHDRILCHLAESSKGVHDDSFSRWHKGDSAHPEIVTLKHSHRFDF